MDVCSWLDDDFIIAGCWLHFADGGIVGCPVGTATCSCYPNDTCNAGLTCASHLCVNLGTGGSGGASGGAGGDAEVPDVPGTEPDVPIGGTVGATGGVPGVGGTSDASSKATEPAVTGTGGSTTPATAVPVGTGGVAGAAGSTGTNPYTPSCGDLLTAAGVAPTKNGICTDTDPQLCYRTCGPLSIGFKSETCTAGAYVEQSGCSFLPGDMSCYKIPTTMDPTCPTEVPQASTACNVAPCTLCNVNNGYLDSSGTAKTGYCVCSPPSATTGASKWSCASSTAWPCPAGQGC